MDNTYHKQVDIDNEMKIRELLKEIPKFCKSFFTGIESATESRTRLAYAYDLRIFFHYLMDVNPTLSKYTMHEIPLWFMDELDAQDIEEYISYLRVYKKDETQHTNSELGTKRKLSALRSLYHYLYQKGMVKSDPSTLVSTPKIHEKAIVRLDIDEVARLLDEVETGDKLTEKQQQYHKQTKLRDVAIMTLLLGTGIRVSECVGLNIEDVDFIHDGIKIHRKGGNEAIVYFGEEVEKVLLDYLEERNTLSPIAGHEEALFLSMQRKRIGVRSVEKLVKKYAQTVTTVKKITPHKLRSTYGTSLYQNTGDIYLVADVLGHKDVNTTRKHYADVGEDRRRMAADKVILRETRS